MRVASRREQDRQDESRRILDRVTRESEAAPSLLGSATKRMRDHLSAADTDPADRIEYWGTRVGRGLGLLITLAIIVALILFIMRGA